MEIAFAVLAVAALVFLIIFNSRQARKSSQSRDATPPAEADGTAAPGSVMPEGVNPALPGQPNSPAEGRRAQADRLTAAGEPGQPAGAAETRSGQLDQPTDLLSKEPGDHALPPRSSRAHSKNNRSDQTYRQALRRFKEEEEHSAESSGKPGEKGKDEAYRRALRSMHRDEEER